MTTFATFHSYEYMNIKKQDDFDIENKKLHVHIAKFGKPRDVSLPQKIIDSFQKHIKSRDKKYPNLNEEQKDIERRSREARIRQKQLENFWNYNGDEQEQINYD